MSNLGASNLTKYGEMLSAKSKTGIKFKFTKICLGDGIAENSYQLNKIVSSKMERPIDKLVHLEGTNQFEVGAMFTNEELKIGFSVNEIGLYAIDPDLGEILYSYACIEGEANSSSFMAPGKGAVIVENDISIITAVSNASAVILKIDPSKTYMREVEVLNNNEKVGNVRKLNFKGKDINIENEMANIEIPISNNVATSLEQIGLDNTATLSQVITRLREANTYSWDSVSIGIVAGMGLEPSMPLRGIGHLVIDRVGNTPLRFSMTYYGEIINTDGLRVFIANHLDSSSIPNVRNWREIRTTRTQITQSDMAINSVGTSQLLNLGVTGAKMANNTVTATQILGINELSGNALGGIAIGFDSVTISPDTKNDVSIAIGRLTNAVSNVTQSGQHTCNIAIGSSARANSSSSIAIGSSATSSHSSSAALGVSSTSTTTSQILLGNTGSTPTAYRALSIISDERDKSDISALTYDSLKFINKIEPKQYKLDFRSDYTRLEEVTENEYKELNEYTKQHRVRKIPVYAIDDIEFIEYSFDEYIEESHTKTVDTFKTKIKSNVLKSREEAINKFTQTHKEQIEELKLNYILKRKMEHKETQEFKNVEYTSNKNKEDEEDIIDVESIEAEQSQSIEVDGIDDEKETETEQEIKTEGIYDTEELEISKEELDNAISEFIEENIKKVRDMKLVRVQLEKDGSKTNKRLHNGVLAQQVKAVADEMGFDFAGFKDHSVNGGDDLYSISYEEFIAPMIGAIQQLTKRLEIQDNKIQELENKLISQ